MGHGATTGIYRMTHSRDWEGLETPESEPVLQNFNALSKVPQGTDKHQCQPSKIGHIFLSNSTSCWQTAVPIQVLTYPLGIYLNCSGFYHLKEKKNAKISPLLSPLLLWQLTFTNAFLVSLDLSILCKTSSLSTFSWVLRKVTREISPNLKLCKD